MGEGAGLRCFVAFSSLSLLGVTRQSCKNRPYKQGIFEAGFTGFVAFGGGPSRSYDEIECPGGIYCVSKRP